MTDVTEAAAGASTADFKPPDPTQQQCSVLAALEDYSITAGLLLTLCSSQPAGLCMSRQVTNIDGTQHLKEKGLSRDLE